MTTENILDAVNAVKGQIALASEKQKNAALLAIAKALRDNKQEILRANAADVNSARGSVSEVMIDRLLLTGERIDGMAEGVEAVAALPDPVGVVLEDRTRADGLKITKITVPLGVVAIIYESRPNVTSDAAALCLKSGNACVLRTGKLAYGTATAIVCAMRSGLEKAGLSGDLIALLDGRTHDSANELMRAAGKVDLLIPRGGSGLINACLENSLVPCIQTGTGVCHAYVDKSADIATALKIIENAKCSRPSVCNALEVCLVDSAIANGFLPALYQKLNAGRDKNKVKFACDDRALAVLSGKSGCYPAQDGDFDREFLDYVLAVKVVDGVEQAVMHVALHSTAHSDCVIARDEDVQKLFAARVDSAAVYINASTRFTDGGEFGFGCEMGISTQKLHVRGPMGLSSLTTYKYVVTGNGNVR